MKPAFADTAFFVALVSPKDEVHSAVARWVQENNRPIVTTGFILAELGNFLSHGQGRARFVQLWQMVRDGGAVTLHPSSDELLAAGFAVFRDRQDKEWSITDCTSFVLMQQLRLEDALTTDHHFEQAGFKALFS